MRLRHAWVFASLAFALLGCEPLSRTRDCNALLDIVNPELEVIAKLAPPARRSEPALLRQLAGHYAALGERVGRHTPAEPRLGKSTHELAGIFTETGAALGELADTLADPAQKAHITEHRRRVDALATRQRTTVTRVNDLCRGR